MYFHVTDINVTKTVYFRYFFQKHSPNISNFSENMRNYPFTFLSTYIIKGKYLTYIKSRLKRSCNSSRSLFSSRSPCVARSSGFPFMGPIFLSPRCCTQFPSQFNKTHNYSFLLKKPIFISPSSFPLRQICNNSSKHIPESLLSRNVCHFKHSLKFLSIDISLQFTVVHKDPQSFNHNVTACELYNKRMF